MVIICSELIKVKRIKMKRANINIKKAFLLFLCGVVMTACGYEEIVSMDYPDSKIYLPTAVNGIYVINDIPSSSTAVPTPGNTYSFKIDPVNNAFNVALAVYRSGLNRDNNVSVNLEAYPDTITSLIAAGNTLLDGVEILSSDKYSIPSNLQIAAGKDYESFFVAVDLEFLNANRGKKCAFAVQIVKADQEINNSLGTTIVVIDTRIMIPEASFTYSLDGTKVKFNSTAKYVTSVLWDFGDGTTSTELNPEHVYDDLGIYDVTLNAKGISGDVSYTLRLKLIQAAKLDHSGWSIVGCDSEEPKEAEWSDSPIAGLAQAAIDGNLTTFWHSQWDKAQPGYPHWFIVDMGREYVISSFVCYRRQGNNGGQTEHKFEVSLDGNNWSDMGTFAFDSQKDAGQTYTMVLLPEARYFRYTATKGPNQYAFLSEIEVYGAPIE